jgi:hypothetical protein
MKNITLAIDEQILKEARALAARRGTSLNAMVRQLLQHEVAQEKRTDEARRGLLELMEKSTARMGPDYKWNREELYADRVFPRHQRPGVRGSNKKG